MTAPGTKRLSVVLLVMLAVVLAVLAYLGVGGGRQYLANRGFTPLAIPAETVAPAAIASALAGARIAPAAPSADPGAPAPTAAGVAAALAKKLTSTDLGPSVSAQVYDARTGASLFGRRPDDVIAPASTAKLLTAAAVLTARNATDRFATRVLAGSAPGEVVLVGGGDPTLSAAVAGQPTEYPQAARISDLAAKVRAALGSTRVTRVLIDGSLFTGASTAPSWEPADAPSEYASAITALMVDAGRDRPGAGTRSAAPDLAAGNALAAALGGADVSRGGTPAGAKVLAEVRSAPVGELVEQMLRNSDNVIAEVLARQVAIAAHQPVTFAGAAAAVSASLRPLGVTAGDGMRDGSGLSTADRLPASALTQALLAAVDPAKPRLGPLLSGLPVAGWDGTLTEEDRFTGSSAVADGFVRAKTGSLTGVSSLAGLATDSDGRLLVFAFVADRAPSEGATRAAIDGLTAALVRCGCR